MRTLNVGNGAFATWVRRLFAQLRETVARHHRVTAAQIRLTWTLHRSPNVLAIPGTGDIDHLQQNVAAGGLKLSEEDFGLSKVSARRPKRERGLTPGRTCRLEVSRCSRQGVRD
ncbi:aldo/keto reductase [Amycolatopsis sp. NPDC059021]|uniref:aldo/keto reductase n=1 Tax=Amycolatopsis sp. NPDC059021 TaxID=3346704 RepID=UPI0036726521